jgi:signal transduction histidine kinase
MEMTAKEGERTILLVDDEADIREVLEISLADCGYRVISAENGAEALELFHANQPPVVLTDIKMPVMDGIELLQKVKQVNPETEVIMITGHGDMDLAIKSLKYEATDFITKPINVDALEIALKRACDRILMRQKLAEYTESLETLLREKSELQDRLSSLGLMIGSISHGVKGLLTGLDGGIYLVEAGLRKKDLSAVVDGWETVKTVIERIRKMVADILYYTKERGLKVEELDGLAFAQEVADVVAPKAAEAGITFKREFESDPVPLTADSGYLQAALLNILDNAVDACQKDQAQRAHCITFELGQDAHDIIFTITDDGIGMQPETVDKLFTLFFSSKGRSGTGLGLFIANKIVGQHGGCIEVDSTLGQGSRFVVRLPKESGE